MISVIRTSSNTLLLRRSSDWSQSSLRLDFNDMRCAYSMMNHLQKMEERALRIVLSDSIINLYQPNVALIPDEYFQ